MQEYYKGYFMENDIETFSLTESPTLRVLIVSKRAYTEHDTEREAASSATTPSSDLAVVIFKRVLLQKPFFKSCFKTRQKFAREKTNGFLLVMHKSDF